MREKIRDKDQLRHILDAVCVILERKGHYTLEEIQENPIVFFGFVKHVEIIGEAVYMLTQEFRTSHPEVEWDVIEGMRHVLVHGYYKIKPKQLWLTMENDIPKLKPWIELYLRETDSVE
jgi:putative toxin-antitoxin system, antitoxin component